MASKVLKIILLFMTLNTLYHSKQVECSLISGDVKRALFIGKTLKYAEITTLTSQSFEDCAKECIRRPRCLSMNYKARIKLCVLNSDDSESSLVQEIGSIFSPIDKWNKYNVGNCWNRTRCDISERCIDGINGPCEPSDCGYPPDIPGAMLKTVNPEIGIYSRIEYACLPSNILNGVATISCQQNGEWAVDRFNCTSVDCGNPKSINNTEFRLLNETTTYGSRAEYSCESEGICSVKMTLVTGNQTVVECQADGQWSTSDIECVKENAGFGECANDSVSLGVGCIIDDTNSINDDKYQEQLTFFQTLTMRLNNITNCARVAVFRHADSFNMDFGFGSFSTSSDACNSIGNLVRNNGVGNKEVDAVNLALEQFSSDDSMLPQRRGVIFVVSDHGSSWNSNEPRTLLNEANSKNVHVVTIKIGGSQQQVTDNHHPIDIPSSQELVTLVEECMTILKDVYNS